MHGGAHGGAQRALVMRTCEAWDPISNGSAKAMQLNVQLAQNLKRFSCQEHSYFLAVELAISMRCAFHCLT